MSSAKPNRRALAPQDRASDSRDVAALPYRSDVMASLGALLNLWDSPEFHLTVPTGDGEVLDEPCHRMIRHLSFRGAMRPSALAAELGTGRSNVSKIVKRLEHEGLVGRDPDPEDSRGSRVHLTESGLQIAQQFYDLGDRLTAHVLNQWHPDDVEAYTRLTARFTEGAIAAADEIRRNGLDAI
jgi:DNA-binding MarR family transcriptional regulator